MNVSLSTTYDQTDITYAVHSNRNGRPYVTLSVEQGPDVVMLHCDRQFLARAIDQLCKARAALDQAERASVADTPVLAQA